MTSELIYRKDVALSTTAMFVEHCNFMVVPGVAPPCSEDAIDVFDNPTIMGNHLKKGGVAWVDGHATMEIPYFVTAGISGQINAGLLPGFQAYNLGFVTPISQTSPPSTLKTLSAIGKLTLPRDYYFQVDSN